MLVWVFSSLIYSETVRELYSIVIMQLDWKKGADSQLDISNSCCLDQNRIASTQQHIRRHEKCQQSPLFMPCHFFESLKQLNPSQMSWPWIYRQMVLYMYRQIDPFSSCFFSECWHGLKPTVRNWSTECIPGHERFTSNAGVLAVAKDNITRFLPAMPVAVIPKNAKEHNAWLKPNDG
jgi:hypothetical protein